MNKQTLAQRISEKMDINMAISNRFIEVFMEILTEEFLNGGHLSLKGFGVFFRWQQTKRLGRNPQNMVPYIIKPRISIKFRPGKTLLAILNSGRTRSVKVETRKPDAIQLSLFD